MKLSRTTLAGGVSAIGFAIALSPGATTSIALGGSLLGSVALAVLGFYTPDCPNDCPGTDDHGNRRPVIKKASLPFVAGAVLICALVLFGGCASPNPLYHPAAPGIGQPPGLSTNAQPAYTVPPSLNVWSNSIVPMATVGGTVAGLGSAPGTIAAGIFAVIGALCGAVARNKSKQLDDMADGIHAAGTDAVQTVLDVASDTTSRPAIAAAIQRARVRRPGLLPASPSTATKNPVDSPVQPRKV